MHWETIKTATMTRRGSGGLAVGAPTEGDGVDGALTAARVWVHDEGRKRSHAG